MEKLSFSNLHDIFYKKCVVVVGSAPSGLDNIGSFIDSFDLVVRVNNYKVKGRDKRGLSYDYTDRLGTRTDYHYSFYGGSIRKQPNELLQDGIKGHLCKCPDDVCHVTQWHIDNKQIFGGDFRGIYRRREGFWVKPVYIPPKDHYLKLFRILDEHVPSTGFACIWEMMNCEPKQLHITGFDFMTSRLHNVNEKWLAGDPNDPIGHDFDKEKLYVKKWIKRHDWITCDKRLEEI